MMADSNPSNMGSQTSLFSVLSLFSLSGGGGGAGEGLNHALVIDGKTLAFAISPELERRFLKICLHCRSVVCCRATPIQKASVVRLVRNNLKKMTLSIGDGANDVSMIQTADIGVGISGQEGMQAVMASDFAIAKFRFLERLLLVHGHWNHDRLCKFSAVMFYKSLITVFVLFWFQIFSGFSGSLMIDSLYLTMQHVVFTSLPPLANGVFDKDLCAYSLLSDPTLYKPGQRGEMYTHWTYVFVLLDSLYQSLALYFIPHVAYQNHGVGLWEFGTTCDVCMIITILLTLCIETNSWVWIQWVCVVVSFVLFWSFLLVSNAIFFTFDHPSNPYWVFMNTVSTASHSSIVIITVFVALLPRLVVRSLQISVFPNEIGLAKRLEKQREQDLLREDVGDVTATTALNTHANGNGRAINSHLTPLPSNTATPSDSGSVEGGQSEMRVLNTHLYTKNTGNSRRKESRFENRVFSSSSRPGHGKGTTSPDSQASEGGEQGDNHETYVRQRSHVNSSDNAINT